MHYLCKKCLKVYREHDLSFTKEYSNDYLSHIYNANREIQNMYEKSDCPNQECDGLVVEIDELIIPTIIELNKKGWNTLYCCSGHLYENEISTYITFENLPKSLPDNFIASGNGIYHKSAKFNNSSRPNHFKRYSQLLDINKTLFYWALELPNFE